MDVEIRFNFNLSSENDKQLMGDKGCPGYLVKIL
jgi:hypothetical protein